MLQLAGPYYRDNGDCPYLDGRDWAADYLLTQGDVTTVPASDIALIGNTFDDPAVRLAVATPAPASERDGLEVLGRLLAMGFRRTGRAFYRANCTGCQECVSIRVDVDAFSATGDQRRALRKNRDVTLEIGTPSFTREKMAMYDRFLRDRYPKDAVTAAGYEHFFVENVGNTREFRYRVGDRLVGIGFVDLVRDGASSVYFFFEPSESGRSLGTYSALREIDFCRQTGRRYLYLGYRIAGCKAMRYKSNYRPHELLHPTQGWVAEDAWPVQPEP